jgi:hypothetical protein
LEQSNSYKAFKTRTQEIFNFAVLVTSSVPVLEHNLELFKSGRIRRISEPDYFQPSVIYTINELTLSDLKSNGLDDDKLDALRGMINLPLYNREFKEYIIARIGKEDYNNHRSTLKRQSSDYIDNLKICSTAYQSKLASYLYFSLFSYFEAFIFDLMHEVIEAFDRLDVSNYLEVSRCMDRENENRVLNRNYDPRKIDKYKKYSKELLNKGYKEPGILMFSSLIEMMKSNLKNMKANDIPTFLEKIFFFKLSYADNLIFCDLRDKRNSLGHGGISFTPNLRNVIDANKFFKRISRNLDEHITRNYMKLNNFQV